MRTYRTKEEIERKPDSKNLFTKHYGNINNSGYNWSSVPYAIVAKMAKILHLGRNVEKKKIYKDRVRK